MKQNRFSVLAAGAVLIAGILTSCSKDDSNALGGNYPADGVVRITTSLGEAQPVSRAATTAYTGKDLSLTVYYGATDKYSRDNIRWNNNSGTWAQDLTTYPDPMLWKNATTPAYIVAYAPYIIDNMNMSSVLGVANTPTRIMYFSVKADQSVEGALVASDLVGYAQAGFVPGSSLSTLNALNITLTHRLSKLSVNLTYGDQYPEGARPTVEKLEVTNVMLEAAYNTTTLTATAEGSAGNLKAATVKADNYEAIVVPQTVNASTQLVLARLSDGTKLAYTTPIAQLFEANKHYTLNLRVGKDKLEVASVTVKEWGSGEEIPGGEAEAKYSIDPSTHAITVFKEGLLTNNLLAETAGNGTQLIVNGKISTDDLRTIKSYFKESNKTITELDLSGAKFDYLVTEFLNRNTMVTSVKLPEGLTTIGDAAFKECSALTTVVLPTSVKTLGYDVFFNCTALTSDINLPNVTSIGYQCFMNCELVKSIELPSVETVAHYAFYGCIGLTEISLPNAIELKASYIFAECTNLKKVNLPKLKILPAHVFSNCSNLNEVHIDIAETLEQFAFNKCAALTTVAFPNIVSVGNDVFRECTLLNSVTLPKATTIGKSAFFDCAELLTIDLPSATTIGDYALQNCKKITTVKFTTAADFVTTAIDNVFWDTFYCSKMDLTINKNKESQVTDGNKWGGVTWKSVSFLE